MISGKDTETGDTALAFNQQQKFAHQVTNKTDSFSEATSVSNWKCSKEWL